MKNCTSLCHFSFLTLPLAPYTFELYEQFVLNGVKFMGNFFLLVSRCEQRRSIFQVIFHQCSLFMNIGKTEKNEIPSPRVRLSSYTQLQ